jgi:hypothetical protein
MNNNQYKLEGDIEMADVGDQERKEYKSQGLGGYEDEESLDNTDRQHRI